MNLFGWELTRKAAVPITTVPAATSSTSWFGGGWWPIVREAFPGAWQRNIETPFCDVLSHPTVFACITLIAGDIAKTRWELVREEPNDVWVKTESAAFSPVLRKPNHYQIPFQLRQQWLTSKLSTGNAYVLKQRDQRGVVIDLRVLDPLRVRVLVAPDSSVFYQLSSDQLAGVEDAVVVPAREIIHDLFNPLFHPLVGVSPLYASGIAAMLGLKIQTGSAHFFENGAQPGGILSAPKSITKETAERMKQQWEENYSGINAGRVAVVGDGVEYTPLGQPAQESQLTEQWKAASQAIADAFHVPWHLVGGPQPPYNNIQSLNVAYYTQCLQPLMTQLEDVLELGLGINEKIEGTRYGVQFLVADLLWMDSLTQMQVIREGVQAGVVAPNEGRARLNLGPVQGGASPYLQQQNYSLAALDKRDSQEDPFAGAAPPEPEPEDEPERDEEPEIEDVEAAARLSVRKQWGVAA